MLSKTNYIVFRDCSKNAWLKIHRPEIYFKHELSEFEKSIIETGNEVELVARKLFPSGVLAEEKGEEAVAKTRELLLAGEQTIFQAAFSKDGFFAAVDVLRRDPETGRCSIYEIKATNEIDKKTHYHDLTFQSVLLKKCGLEIEAAHIIHLDKEYVREGELDIEKLFKIEDATGTVEEMAGDVADEMELALEYAEKPDEPRGPCDCIYKGRSGQCTTAWYSNPDIQTYGIHDLSRIGTSKAKLRELVDGHKFRLEDVPEEMELSEAQKNQIWTHLHDTPIISKENVGEELEKIEFPVYFLDYETFPSALPRFDGYSPYNQIPFQYSLHILKNPDDEPEHFGFLCTENTDPSLAFLESLKNHVGDKGSVIVWHKDFECGRNKELAKRRPEYAGFIDALNKRIYDLELVFKKQHYVHKDFKGKSSIKKVLPVLVPSLKYDGLEIREGGSAAESWDRIARGEVGATEEKEKMIDALIEYCKLDTYAMYAIWRELRKILV